MAKKTEQKGKKKKKGASGPTDTLREAVERTFAGASGGAAATRDRAQDLLEDIATQLRGLRDANLVGTLEGLRDDVQSLAKRVASLELRQSTPAKAAPKPASTRRASTSTTRTTTARKPAARKPAARKATTTAARKTTTAARSTTAAARKTTTAAARKTTTAAKGTTTAAKKPATARKPAARKPATKKSS